MRKALARSITIVTTMCLAMLGATLVSSAASASGGVCNPGCSANVEWRSGSNTFVVHDYHYDGKATVGLIQVKQSGAWFEWGRYFDRNGYYGPAAYFTPGIRDGATIRYKACLVKNTNQPYSCSGWYSDKA